MKRIRKSVSFSETVMVMDVLLQRNSPVGPVGRNSPVGNSPAIDFDRTPPIMLDPSSSGTSTLLGFENSFFNTFLYPRSQKTTHTDQWQSRPSIPDLRQQDEKRQSQERRVEGRCQLERNESLNKSIQNPITIPPIPKHPYFNRLLNPSANYSANICTPSCIMTEPMQQDEKRQKNNRGTVSERTK